MKLTDGAQVLGAIILARGKEFILHVYEAFKGVSDEFVVVLNQSDDIGLYEHILPEGVKVTTDIGGCPLIGACSGLRIMRSEFALILPCDTPFISTPVLRHLLDRSTGFDATVPRWPNGYTEPLHSVYRVETAMRACAETMSEGNMRITGLISRSSTNCVPVEELRIMDPELLTFFNINSHQDLNKAEMILQSRSSEIFRGVQL